MWSKLATLKSTSGHLKIGQSNRCAVAAARRKAEEQNTMWSARKQSTERCGQKQPKPSGQAMWSKAIAKSKWMWYNKYADIAKRPSRRAYNPEALVWLQLPLYRFNMKISLWEQGSDLPSQGLFFFRRCRIVTLVKGFLKLFSQFVCYSSVGHDELNAIYRKRYARPWMHLSAPQIIGSNKRRIRRRRNPSPCSYITVEKGRILWYNIDVAKCWIKIKGE